MSKESKKLSEIRPDLLKEWNVVKNIGLSMEEIKSKSNRNVHWICSKGHEFQARVYDRVNGSKCPYCSNRKTLKGYNDLAATNPELIQEWHSTKNNGLSPSDFTYGSEVKVWWLCNEGHEYQQSIIHRTRGSGCPYCSGQKVLKGFNDLETVKPEIATEWHPTKNNGLSPSDFTYGSGRKVWWLCNENHEYEATITNRTKPTYATNCPYCNNRAALKGYNDLATKKPLLAKEWNLTKNNDITPDKIAPTSNKKVWWICDKGHEFEAIVSNRSRREDGCPYCNNKKVMKGFNDLETTHPKIAKEWHQNKNKGMKPSDFTFGSGKEVWWKCERNHSWRASIDNRTTKKSGCPECIAEMKTSFPELAIYYYIKKQFSDAKNRTKLDINNKTVEPDIWIPKLNFAIDFDGYWPHKNSTKRDTNKNKKFAETKEIHYLRIREILKGNYLPNLKPDNNTKYIHHQVGTKDELALLINSIFDFINKEFNLNIDYYITKEDIEKDEIEIRNLISYIIKENSLVSKYQEIAKCWHQTKNGNLTPDNVNYGSEKRVWWVCPIGHEYQTSIHSRIKGNSNTCPYCSGQKILVGFNDLETTHFKIASEWNYSKNNSLTPKDITRGSSKKCWWICSKGHEYEAKISNRTINKTGCPYCSGQKVLVGFNDLETTHPKIASEWHPSKNNPLTPKLVTKGSRKKCWWICKEGHEYEQTLNNRTSNNRGCPYCSKNK